MAKPCEWSVLLLVLLAATTLVEGQIAQWNFANFSSARPFVDSLGLLEDALVFNATGSPRLLLNSRTGVAIVGRVVFPNQVQFKEATTRAFASFSTNFTFAINNSGNASVPPAGCGGFAFQIQADNSSVGQTGEYLSLTTAADDGAPTNSLFAVEFDTSLDVSVDDPSGSHMGVDLNSVKSTSTYDLCPFASNCTSLVNDGIFFAKIDYSGTLDRLEVELRTAANATITIASWTVESVHLQPLFQDYMYVGFSGSNGAGCDQTTEIFSWGFSTSRSSPDPPADASGPSAHVSYNCYRLDGCGSHRALMIWITAAVGGSAIAALFICIYCCYCRKKPGATEYAAVENKSNSGPVSTKGTNNALLVKLVKASDVEAPPVHTLPPASEIDLPCYNKTERKDGMGPITEQAVDPKSVAVPVAEPVNRNAEPGKVTMCCMQTKPKRDYKEPVVFSLKELAQATKNFSEKQVIGGTPERRPVYKGVLRDNAAVIAIKELTLDNISNEFLSKAMVLGRIRHPNLVQLLGWCKCPEKSKLYLVYDYMPRGSLDKLLVLTSDAEEGFLGFDARHQILMGVAAGLMYLHEEWEQCVLHRDVKPSNVLLDAAGNVHLGNFSHASLVDHNKLAESTVLDGTLGYMAPEIPFTGKPTVKSDVFSFGILTLELACGRRPVDWQAPREDRVLLDSVWGALEDGDVLRTVDKRLDTQTYTQNRMTTLLHVGLACAHPDPSVRPDMAFVRQILIGRAPAPELSAKKPVVENYGARSSLGLMKPPFVGATSSDPPQP